MLRYNVSLHNTSDMAPNFQALCSRCAARDTATSPHPRMRPHQGWSPLAHTVQHVPYVPSYHALPPATYKAHTGLPLQLLPGTRHKQSRPAPNGHIRLLAIAPSS